ncbi:hypothetical protein MSIM_22720 [Mycobacterium simiae]|nr:hypothetical protein MSIM_22720 [Mycobacterium simiae]
MARPPETSICAASAAQASRKLADTTAAPKINSAATGSGCKPMILMTTAGAMKSAVISADRTRVRRGNRLGSDTADTPAVGAGALSVASIVILVFERAPMVMATWLAAVA